MAAGTGAGRDTGAARAIEPGGAGPPGTAWLDGARNVPLAGIGHVSLLRHPRAVDATLAALAALRTPAPMPQQAPQHTSIFM